MSKIVLNDISNITGNPTSAEQLINANFTAIEEAIENTLSRDGTTPNFLEASLDANSQRIVNLPYALSGTEPVTLAQVMALVTGEDWTGGAGIPSVVYYQDAEPTATASGQVWVKTNGEFYIWDGTTWIKQVDPTLTYAINQADAAVATANAASALIDGAADDAADALTAANSAVSDIALLSPRVLAVEQDVANVQTAIIDLETEDTNLAGLITSVTADLGDLNAAVVAETLARAQGDQALASSIQQIQVANAPAIYIQASAPVPGVSGVPNPIVNGSIWYDSDDGNRQYRWLNSQWNDVTDAQIGTLYGLISTETTARISGDSANATSITTLQTQRNSDYALIVANNTARINADAAISARVDGVVADVSGLQAAVVTEQTARTNGDSSLASSISTVQSSLNTTNSNLTALTSTVTTNNQARIDGDNALASSINAVNTTVGTLSTTVSQNTSSINGINGRYTLQIDSNGYVSGIDLIQNASPGTAPYSTMTVLANAFKIVTPGATPITPFQVVDGVTYIKDVRIDTATIGTATIGTTNIAGGAVSNVNQTILNFLGTAVAGTTANTYRDLSSAYGTAAVTMSGLSTTAGSKSNVYIRGYFNARGAGGNIHWCFFRLRRDDGVILTGQPQIRLMGDYTMTAWEWVDLNPVSATHTYTVQVMRSSNENIGNWQEISIIGTNIKR